MVGGWRLVIGGRWLVVGGWRLVVGVGRWSVVALFAAAGVYGCCCMSALSEVIVESLADCKILLKQFLCTSSC